MIIILGDLIADLSMHIPSFPVEARAMPRATYMELGPGGATNVAIAASRLGLDVAVLGEVGDDQFGEVVLEGLVEEGVDITHVEVTPGAETPVAGVIVDSGAEPAYIGYPGSLQLKEFPESWKGLIADARALFVDGWAETPDVPGLLLDGLKAASTADVPVFFDAGPGNPRVDNVWWDDALAYTTVFLATEDEARGFTHEEDPWLSARKILSGGPELVVIKRGPAGCILLTAEEEYIAPGFPVRVLDTTGAGDSLDAAILFAYLKGWPLEAMGQMANATGAAKVRKRGTGHNVPRPEETLELLERFAPAVGDRLRASFEP